MLHRSAPGLGIVAHGERPERHLASAALQAGASAYVARTAGTEELRRAVDAAARPGALRRPGRAAERQPRQADPPPARDPAAARRRRVDHRRRPRARPQRGDGEDPHQERPRPPRRQNRTHAVAIALRECLID